MVLSAIISRLFANSTLILLEKYDFHSFFPFFLKVFLIYCSTCVIFSQSENSAQFNGYQVNVNVSDVNNKLRANNVAEISAYPHVLISTYDVGSPDSICSLCSTL